jgi:hypothetical protein
LQYFKELCNLQYLWVLCRHSPANCVSWLTDNVPNTFQNLYWSYQFLCNCF